MHVALVADVEEEFVPGRIEGAVQGDGQFDHTEVGPEVPAGLGDRADEFLADFPGEARKVGFGDGTDIGRAVDPGEEGRFRFLRRHRTPPRGIEPLGSVTHPYIPPLKGGRN